jgi:alkyl sulfatase BDS1-like metallo-beta-lactamase superfamily hydrolase
MSTPVQDVAQARPAKQKTEQFLVTAEGTEAVAPGAWILHGQGQSMVFELDVGLVVVDAGPGGRVTEGMIRALRQVSDAPVHAICFSHGHLGYNAGLEQWLAHARGRGEPKPRAIAHANMPRRALRYRETLALQTRMAELQFRRDAGVLEGKLPVPLPEETFEHSLLLGDAEGRHVELLWAPSETDDAIAVWYPAERLLYGGPSTIDSIPNVGTPFRTQRDPVRWADTLEHLATLKPALLVREFGASIAGEEAIASLLTHTAEALRWIRKEVVRLMNAGLSEPQMLAVIQFPAELFDVPFMKPTYGDPYWIARDVYKSENGWWDRNPTTLHPAPPDQVSAALGAAITDKQAVLRQARALAEQGETQLALHVIDLLAALQLALPECEEARRLKAQWMTRRASETRSYISKSLYHASAKMLAEGHAADFGIR